MNDEKELNSGSGNRQAAFAGTNPNKYDQPDPANGVDNVSLDEEAQNLKEGADRLSEDEIQHAVNKANAGTQQGDGNS